jgi:membrane-associated phospholipid phosphatase
MPSQLAGWGPQPPSAITAPSGAPRRLQSRPSAVSPVEVVTELAAGVLLLGVAALAGLVFVHRPWPNRLDAWGDLLLPAAPSARWALDLADLGSMAAVIVGVIAVFLIGARRDWVRAVACAAAPVLAVLLVQDFAKPLVGRHYLSTGGLSYPSGTVAAVAALATGLTLVTPARRRFPTGALGLLATLAVGAAVIVLRWHYPTDVVGGVAVGVGSVLSIDALVHVPWIVRSVHGRRPGVDRLHPSGPGCYPHSS